MLFFNDKDVRIIKSFTVSELIESDTAYIFNWKPGFIIPFGIMQTITIDLMPHQSKLFWLCQNNQPPPKQLTIGGRLSDRP